MPAKYKGHFVLEVTGKEDVKACLRQLKMIPNFYYSSHHFQVSLNSKIRSLKNKNLNALYKPPQPTVADLKTPDKFLKKLRACNERHRKTIRSYNIKLEKLKIAWRKKEKELLAKRVAAKEAHKKKYEDKYKLQELYKLLFGK